MALSSYPPSLPARFPGAHLLAFRRDALGFLRQLSQTCGDVASFRLGPERMVLLTHPEHIRDVLVTHHRVFIKGRRGEVAKQFLGEGLFNSEGAVHRRQRYLMQPAFHRQRVATYATVMAAYGARVSQQWHDGETLEIAREMMHLTLMVAGKALFGTEVAADTDQIGAALSTLMHLSRRFNLPGAAWLTKLPLPSNIRLRRAQHDLDTIISRMIHARRAGGVDTGDVLSMLLLADDETGEGGGMTEKQVHDEALTLLLAGHETTANVLTWTWYLLAQHPTVEATLHAELESVLGGRLPTETDISRLPYTRMVLTEAMRLYPPAWLMTRRALEDHELGGYLLPARTFILISPYVTHHDPRFFPAPEVFNPERWAAEHDQSRPKFAYFPFGGGPRQCLGEHFAWLEGILLLATLAQQWQMRLVPDHPVALLPLVTLRPQYGMRMTLARRHSTAYPVLNSCEQR